MEAVGGFSVACDPLAYTTMRDHDPFVLLFPALLVPTAGTGKGGGVAGCSPAISETQEKSGVQRQRAACHCPPPRGTLADCLPPPGTGPGGASPANRRSPTPPPHNRFPSTPHPA